MSISFDSNISASVYKALYNYDNRQNTGKVDKSKLSSNMAYLEKMKSAANKTDELSSTAETKNVGSTRSSVATSSVDESLKKHPEWKESVNSMVDSGIKAREMYGAKNVDVDSMTMDKYKSYISDIIGKIPFDASHPYDEETVYISEEGWEQMKKDPKYEAWVLGYTVENRAVKNPFFGMGDKGAYCIENFGASIEEHKGAGYSKVYTGSARTARSMYETASSGSGAIKTKAPQADLQPDPDWTLEEQLKKNRKIKDYWDEVYEARLYQSKKLQQDLNNKYYEKMRISQIEMMSSFNNNWSNLLF